MRPIIAILVLIVIACGAFYLYDANFGAKDEPNLITPPPKPVIAKKAPVKLPFKDGEQLTYSVYYKNMLVGKSVLTFHGEKRFEGEDVYHITFNTNLRAFEDLEELYAYKETFLPYRVSRVIKRFGGFATNISEEYDQDNFKVHVRKESKLCTEDFTIERDAPIHNAILVSYFYRTKPEYKDGEEFKVTLPTSNFDVALRGVETVKTQLGRKKAHVFCGAPSKFTFWLSTDEEKVPIKIKSHTTMDYSMVLRSKENVAR